mgnify:CR=1 FL=1
MSNQDTFRFLEQSNQGSNNAASKFLKARLANNKYVNGDPYALGEGFVPGGEAYELDRKIISGKPKEASSTQAKPSDTPKKGPLQGSMSVDEIRKEFNIQYDGEKEFTGGFGTNKKTGEPRLQNDQGDVWYKDAAGEIKYLGNVGENGKYVRGSTGTGANESSGSASDGGRFFAGDDNKKGSHHQSAIAKLQASHDERHGPGHSNGFNSINDLSGALQHLIGDEKPKEEPVVKEPMTPIEHSPEIKQAKERVKAYEENVISGKTSQEIYGKGEAIADNKYVFDASKGAAGIGVNPVSASQQSSADAADSFLDNKVSQVKKTLSPVN